jgi:hypothetical protein
MTGKVIVGPWSSHPFRGQPVVMIARRKPRYADVRGRWGKLHLGNPLLPLCGVRPMSPRTTLWRSKTFDPGAYREMPSPCDRCLKKMETKS